MLIVWTLCKRIKLTSAPASIIAWHLTFPKFKGQVGLHSSFDSISRISTGARVFRLAFYVSCDLPGLDRQMASVWLWTVFLHVSNLFTVQTHGVTIFSPLGSWPGVQCLSLEGCMFSTDLTSGRDRGSGRAYVTALSWMRYTYCMGCPYLPDKWYACWGT